MALTRSLRASVVAGAALLALLPRGAWGEAQHVWLDFDSGRDDVFAYTAEQRDQVQALMKAHFAGFDVRLVQSAPATSEYSRIVFNSGGPGGLAEAIDARNLDRGDIALVNAYGVLAGMPGLTDDDVVMASAIIGSHELGHLLGLRHGDAFGPIGMGLTDSSPRLAGRYRPAYPGPTAGDETNDHIMASPASVGSSLDDLLTPSWFSERSAMKLAFAERGAAVPADVAAGRLPLAALAVPNPLLRGDHAGETFVVDAAVVLGSRPAGRFTFEAAAGDLLNVELMSQVLRRIESPIDPLVRVLNSAGEPVPYGPAGTTAVNDDEFESRDAVLLDLRLPADDTYTVVVAESPSALADATGAAANAADYELLATRFALAGDAGPPAPPGGLLDILSVDVPARRGRASRLVDGDLGTAWVGVGAATYFDIELADVSRIDALAIATRADHAHALRISVDGEAVWEAMTQATEDVVSQLIELPAGTSGRRVRVRSLSQPRFVVAEVALRGRAPATLEPVLVRASTAVAQGRAANLIDGRLSSSWRNDGTAETAYVEVSVASPRRLPVLQVAPAVNRSMLVDVLVDGVFSRQIQLQARPERGLQSFELNETGQTIRLELRGDRRLRLHEVALSATK
ncbi:MAG: hypothetical protein AAF515_07625 [Pseudomonadota bacterium]